MGILYPALPIAVVLAIFTLLARHALEMRTKQNYREMWGATTLALLPAAVFWFIVCSGEPDVLTRTILLIPAGAIIGACAFVWAGYVVHDMTAKAQTVPLTQGQPTMSPKVGDESVVIGNVKHDVGNKSVVIGATDERGNVILNQGPLAIGHGAQAGPGSIAIGTNAGAGIKKPE